ncbi:hypothetical protein BTJ68_08590 [Hortaea werneckii EXF-2000]|uniref:NAD(P)-binding protein n=1 Tax=Hortaea werneckii EXF-2000 TaxID=1157616 RepID=A0A1Z5T100_HORWE|nr:hypothetical protein BTJ68_08590 [Hortaea werneckii EXF-2000]
MVVGNITLKDKVAVVTGGGSGINLCFVRLALQAGARVLIADLKLLPEAEQLVAENKDRAFFMKCDVSNWRDLENVPSSVAQAFGKDAVADVWIPGAGVFEPKWSSFLIAMRSCLSVNKPCVVLITASTAGFVGTYGAPLYCASKHAIVGFTKSMGQADVDENCKIVCICPGIVATPLWTGDEAKHVASQFSYNESMAVTPEEVAEAMMEMVTSGEWEGGSMMEITKATGRRKLDSLRAEDRIKESGLDADAVGKFMDGMQRPIREVWAKERGLANAAK